MEKKSGYTEKEFLEVLKRNLGMVRDGMPFNKLRSNLVEAFTTEIRELEIALKQGA